MIKPPFSFRLTSLLLVIALFAAALGLSQPAGAAPDPGLKWEEKVDPWVMETAAKGKTEFLVFLAEQADLSAAAALPTKLEKGTYVYQTLSALAARTQMPVLEQLKGLGAEHRSYWVANMIWVRGGMGAVQAMAQRGDVAHLYANPKVRLEEPAPAETLAPEAIDAIVWNITLVNADDVWAAGYRGQGAVVGGADTGYQWDHPALINAYRGWDGDSADHNYNWHDAIHSGTSSCGVNLTEPCDDHYMGHGTHTMGTMVGDDGGDNQIGMAPAARWIGCRNMAEGYGTLAAYTECYQWFIAPTDLANLNPRPDLAPDVINNSWSCLEDEGCADPNALLTVVNSVRAAGILTVHAAGNYGGIYPYCFSVKTPAAIYDASYTVGNTTKSGYLYTLSSLGPVTVDGSNRMKPDISAPGTDIYSSVPTDTYQLLTGTSMAAPHVAGLAALLISANPLLAGHPDSLETYINRTATPDLLKPVNMPEECGDKSFYDDIPNNHFGWGRIDALAAFQALDDHALALTKTASTDLAGTGETITYTLTITHTHPFANTNNLIVTDTLPEGTYFISASPGYTRSGNTITWNLGTLAPGQEVVLTLKVLIGFETTDSVTNEMYSTRSDQVAPVYGEPVTTMVYPVPYHKIYLPITIKE